MNIIYIYIYIYIKLNEKQKNNSLNFTFHIFYCNYLREICLIFLLKGLTSYYFYQLRHFSKQESTILATLPRASDT